MGKRATNGFSSRKFWNNLEVGYCPPNRRNELTGDSPPLNVSFSVIQTAITSSSGSICSFSMLSIAINVPVSELGHVPQAP